MHFTALNLSAKTSKYRTVILEILEIKVFPGFFLGFTEYFHTKYHIPSYCVLSSLNEVFCTEKKSLLPSDAI
jgi:hypothetical protein